MKTNPTHRGTYTGQPAKLYVAFTNSCGRKLYALRTAGGVVATTWDTSRDLRRFAVEKHLPLTIDSK